MVRVVAHVLLSAWLSLSAPLAVISSDTFTDTNSTAITAHTMNTGGGWTEVSTCDVDIQSNKASVISSNGGICNVVTQTSDADVRIVVDVVVPNTGDYSIGIAFRSSSSADNNNGWSADITRSSSGTPQLRLVKTVSGSASVPDAQNLGAVSGTTQTITLDLNGNSISAAVGAVTASTTDSFNASETLHGLYSYTGSPFSATLAWDNWSVDSTPGGGGGGPTINPATINTPIRGGGRLARWLF